MDFKAVNIATTNVKAAGLTKHVTIAQQDFKDFKGVDEPAIIVTNPPYGERISTQNLLETYKMIGERLKHAFKEGDAWILSYKDECFQQIGLKPSVKVPLYNGSLECEFRKYQMFSGGFREFRQEGGSVKTEEEKRQMAEKRRSWKKREYEKQQEELQNNEEADILNFNFTSLERQRERERERQRREFKGAKGSRNSRDSRDYKDYKKNKKYTTRAERQNDRKNFFNRANNHGSGFDESGE